MIDWTFALLLPPDVVKISLSSEVAAMQEMAATDAPAAAAPDKRVLQNGATPDVASDSNDSRAEGARSLTSVP